LERARSLAPAAGLAIWAASSAANGELITLCCCGVGEQMHQYIAAQLLDEIDRQSQVPSLRRSTVEDRILDIPCPNRLVGCA